MPAVRFRKLDQPRFVCLRVARFPGDGVRGRVIFQGFTALLRALLLHRRGTGKQVFQIKSRNSNHGLRFLIDSLKQGIRTLRFNLAYMTKYRYPSTLSPLARHLSDYLINAHGRRTLAYFLANSQTVRAVAAMRLSGDKADDDPLAY